MLGDRLVDNHGYQWLHNAISDTLPEWAVENADVETWIHNPSSATVQGPKSSWGPFDNDNEVQVYQEIQEGGEGELGINYNKALAQLTEHTAQYNNAHDIDMKIFEYMIQHVMRACRVLSLPDGHMMLLGSCGEGRKSCLRLAAYMMHSYCYELTITPDYDSAKWGNDVKNVLLQAGVEGLSTVFVLTEAQLQQTDFVGDMRSLIDMQQVPDIFSLQEQNEIAKNVLKAYERAYPNNEKAPSTQALLDFFISRVKQFLHVAFVMNFPVASRSTLTENVKANPCLISCCTIDVFDPWPEDALKSVRLMRACM